MTTAAPIYIPVRPRVMPRAAAVRPARREWAVRARFENALTTVDNERHWNLANGMSIDAAANPSVRYVLRNRARQEYQNNSYLMGIADTVGNYVIGTGPSLQMASSNKLFNRAVEKLWQSWAAEADLAQTMKTARVAQFISGEAITLIGTDPEMDSPVKLSLAEIECDRLSTPMIGSLPSLPGVQFLDGIELSPYGRPAVYHILRTHPGGSWNVFAMGSETDPFPARYVMHQYRRIRPEQRRGVTEVASALNEFADIRRYANSVMAAADNAANLSDVIESDASADTFNDDAAGGADQPQPFERIPLEHGEAIVVPAGFAVKRLQATQPVTTYEMFINAKLQAAARCTNLPLMFVTMNPAGANMSASYVVTEPFARSVEADRRLICEPQLNRAFKEFLLEAMRVPGLLPNDVPVDFMSHVWRWPKVRQHADPSKVATGHDKMLANGLTSGPAILGADGQDWEEVQESNAKFYGMTLPEYQAALRQVRFATPGNPVPASTDPEPTSIIPTIPDPPDRDDEDEPEMN